MDDIIYKGYTIECDLQELADGRWSFETIIYKDKSYGVVDKIFPAESIYKTKEEAIKNCINFGKQIVDGEIDGYNVNDL